MDSPEKKYVLALVSEALLLPLVHIYLCTKLVHRMKNARILCANIHEKGAARRFLSCPEPTKRDWLDCIRCTVWECIEFEDQLPLSWDALWLHCCWVTHFWGQAANNSYHLSPESELAGK